MVALLPKERAIPAPSHVSPSRALWSLSDGIWGVSEGRRAMILHRGPGETHSNSHLWVRTRTRCKASVEGTPKGVAHAAMSSAWDSTCGVFRPALPFAVAFLLAVALRD